LAQTVGIVVQHSVEVEDERLDENYHVLIGVQAIFEAASKYTHFPVRAGPRVCDKLAYLLESVSPLTVNGAVLPRADFLHAQERFIISLGFIKQVTIIYKLFKTRYKLCGNTDQSRVFGISAVHANLRQNMERH